MNQFQQMQPYSQYPQTMQNGSQMVYSYPQSFQMQQPQVVDQFQQTQLVGNALTLEKQVAHFDDEITRIENEKPPKRPKEPVCGQVSVEYPEPQSTIEPKAIGRFMPFVVMFITMLIAGIIQVAMPEPDVGMPVGSIIGFIIAIVSFIWWIAYLYSFAWMCVLYKRHIRKRQNRQIEQIRNSPEYQAQCMQIYNDACAEQNMLNQQYAQAMYEYQAITLPRFEQDKAIWTADRDQRLNNARQLLAQTAAELSALYENTRMIPLQYQKIDALEYIYNMMSTSAFPLGQAIEWFNQEQRKNYAAQTLTVQQKIKNLNETSVQLHQQTNCLLDEQNNLSAQMVVQQERTNAAIIGTGVAQILQNHKTNQTLNNIARR